MRDLKQKYLLGLVDVTPRREYRDHILFLDAACESLQEALDSANKQKAEWFGKYTDIKQAHDELLKLKSMLSEQLAAERAKVTARVDEVRNLNAYIEKLKKEKSALQDKLENAEGLAQRLALAQHAAEKDAASQKKAYVELANDYDLLKEEYDNLRVSIAMTQAEDKTQPEEYTVEAPSSPGELFEDIEVVASEAPMTPEEVIVGEPVLVEDDGIDDESVIELADEEPLPSSPEHPSKKKSKKRRR